jgi:hypothetical protein
MPKLVKPQPGVMYEAYDASHVETLGNVRGVNAYAFALAHFAQGYDYIALYPVGAAADVAPIELWDYEF